MWKVKFIDNLWHVWCYNMQTGDFSWLRYPWSNCITPVRSYENHDNTPRPSGTEDVQVLKRMERTLYS